MATHIDATSDKDPVIVMSRIFNAPRDLVWQACTEPRHIVHWWGGQGFSNPVCEMDLRPGGAWRHVMRTPDGSELTFNFVFLEVEPPKRLAWRPAETHPGGPPLLMQTMTFEDLGDQRTRWTLTALAGSFADRDAAVDLGYAAMISPGLEKLSEYLGSL
jgi:uncharacterized protein YndB with AHSA1/START domain